MSEHVLELLLRELDVDPGDVVTVPGLLDLTALWAVLRAWTGPTSRTSRSCPATHPAFAERETPRSVFATLREGDVLVHHPYDSFSTSVQRFIEQAAADPDVLAIKQTLYRTSGDSPIVDALIDAAEAGKQVVALVEIKARFDEQANIRWARELEKAGVHVVYGLVGLKTHCKTSLVVRQEGSHDPALLPHRHRQLQPEDRPALRGHRACSPPTRHRRRPDRPVQLAHRLLPPDLLPQPAGRALRRAPRHRAAHRGRDRGAPRRQRRRPRSGSRSNSLVDEQVIDALYRASQAGVPVDVVVRGICAIRPGRAGAEREHPRAVDPRAGSWSTPGCSTSARPTSTGSAAPT